MRRAWTVIVAAGVIAGCGQTKTVTVGTPAQVDPPRAAEPVAGPPVAKPRGTLVNVGHKPEGIAVDPSTHLAAIAVESPAALVILDDRSGRILRRVALPGTARHVSLAAPGGPFLVPAETANQLVEVDERTGRTRATAVGSHPHDAAAVGDRYFTADEFGSTMSEVRDGRLLSKTPTDAQPGSVAAIDGKIALIAVRAYTVELYDAGDHPRAEGGQSAGTGPSHVVVGPSGRLAIADTRGKALVVYDTRPVLRFRARVPLGGTPVGLAADPARGLVWAALSERATIKTIDLRPAVPVVGQSIATVRDPFSIGEDSATGRLVSASRLDGTVQLIDP